MTKRDVPITLSVWPGLAPGETTALPGQVCDDRDGVTRLTGVTGAEMLVYGAAPEEARPAVIVCPGGGYEILATDLEGAEIASWLNTLGYVAAVLHYRVPGSRDGALQDGQRAVSLLRARASEFGINPACLSVMGFSAGGHLAVRLAVAGISRAYARIDSVDDASCRPDFVLAIYPAYLISSANGRPTPEVKPHPAMPPVFLAQSLDDTHFCTTAYALSLAEAGVAVQSQLYESGGHGYGIRLNPDVPAARWQADAACWLQEAGSLSSGKI